MQYFGMTRDEYLKQFTKPDWACEQLVRIDRGLMVEDICEHGVGHPNRSWMGSKYCKSTGIHGCCGCCSK